MASGFHNSLAIAYMVVYCERMKPFARRRALAKSFVVTMAALPACAGADGQKPRDPVADPAPSKPHNPSDCSSAGNTSDSCIREKDPFPTTNEVIVRDDNWTITMNDGRCYVQAKRMCEPNCKPAAQKEYECPPNYASMARDFTSIERTDKDTCMLFFTGDTSCPKDAFCNPPRPRTVKCPDL